MSEQVPMTIRNCVVAFRCKAQWECLVLTRHARIRFCAVCQKEVHQSLSEDELIENVQLNRCIAIVDPYTPGSVAGSVVDIEAGPGAQAGQP